jgi:hypothetical protein
MLIVRRVLIILCAAACAAGGFVGCGMIAGVDDPYDTAALGEAGAVGAHDATVAESGIVGTIDGSTLQPDAVQLPDAIYTPDASEQAPDAADAACQEPQPGTCTDKNPCCAPAVCNSSGKCVSSCVDGTKPVGCGSDLACCYGERCNENFACEGSCKGVLAGCSQFGAPCCLGFVCPFPAGLCQACAKNGAQCQNVWECCSKNCAADHKCH